LSIAKKREIVRTGKESRDEIIREANRQQEISFLWNKASFAYSSGDYETATNIWQQLYDEYHLESRPFFNNWGSTLLNLAKQKNKIDPEREKLLKEAVEKYERAESFTRGIAAYNLASIYAIMENEEVCRDWLTIAKDAGRLLPLERIYADLDLKKYSDRSWFKELVGAKKGS
jgi:hypothetical protein